MISRGKSGEERREKDGSEKERNSRRGRNERSDPATRFILAMMRRRRIDYSGQPLIALVRNPVSRLGLIIALVELQFRYIRRWTRPFVIDRAVNYALGARA